MIIALLLACPAPSAPPDGSCDEPSQYWPDADGDGVGEPTSTYMGCSPPDGWVTEVALASVVDTYLWDTGPYGDSGDSGLYSTADTGWSTADTAWSTAHTGLWTGGTGLFTGETGPTGGATAHTGATATGP